ncbi:MAG: serine/threonine protein kinase [Polyangiaceae bacterium]|nr:serine/threonine protein kinase [Polyangiaceae bacterium]
MPAGTDKKSTHAPMLAKYELCEELGHGGMATVYRAHDPRLARDVAIKVLHPHLKESGEIAHRFAVEAKAVAKLRHPNIVEVFDVSAPNDAEQYIVVELVRGETLRAVLDREGSLPPEIAAALGAEILAALGHAHAEGVVHRDVKPENVLVEHRAAIAKGANRPATLSVKLTDFGIAKLIGVQGVTSTGQVLGSPAHMAPEQIEGGEVDGRADVFGVGVLLYECMVGHRPFEGANPAQVLRRVLDGFYASAESEKATIGKVWSQILDHALHRNVGARFVDALAMHAAIVAELTRVGFGNGREELEAYFDDPKGYSSKHSQRLIANLCALGSEASKRGDAIASAGDYNRALALAPDDPELLRIVSTMHRAEARARWVRRALPFVFGVVLLGVSALFVARALRAGPLPPTAVKTTDHAVHSPSALPSHGEANAESSASEANEALPTPSGPTPPAIPALHRRGAVSAAAVAAKGKHRLLFRSVQPPAGVWASLDGAQAFEVTSGLSVNISNERHTLTLSCKNPFSESDLCEVDVRAIEPSEIDQTIFVRLKILPATLIVNGDVTHSYRVEQWPSMKIFAGQPASIPMRTGSDRVTVVDNTDNTKRDVKLEAGVQATVSFK